jgi:hypothetical protein
MQSENFSKGDKVIINTREGKMLKGIYSHKCPNGKGYIKAEDGRSYERELHNIKKIANAETLFQINNQLPGFSDNTDYGQIKISPPKSEQWDINKKFDFLSQLTRMIINKTSVSLIITGEGGLGKSYTVKRELLIKDLEKGSDFEIIKGFSTPRGLYRTLYEHNGKLIIFDDCDEVLDDKIAKNLLKGALDSYDSREISWITKTSDPELPDSFDFTGRVIFISNKSQDKIDQAILSRSMSIDLTMSTVDKLKRMEFIVETSKDFMVEYPLEYKTESLDLIKENIDQIREFSLRSLEKVVKIRAGQDQISHDEDGNEIESDWKELAKFMLIS